MKTRIAAVIGGLLLLTVLVIRPVQPLVHAAVPAVTVSTSAVTEGYFTTFSLSLQNPATGAPQSGYVEFTNNPASASDTDYYVDVASVPAGSPMPAYGQFGWSDLGPSQVSTPVAVNGKATVEVLAYDMEATGDPDAADAGQNIGIAWSSSVNGPFTSVTPMPVTPATLIASPASIMANTSTPVTFTLTSATGAPLGGFAVQPETGSGPSGQTGANGTVTLTLSPSAAGATAFFAENNADNGNNLAGIQYAGPYATATVTATAPPSSPPPAPPSSPPPTPPPSPPPAPSFRPTVILARSDLPYDALVGQVLADRTHWPVFLTPPTVLESGIINTWKAEDVGRVVILGGPAAISPQIADEIMAMGIKVTRIWGWDRYGTAAALASYLGDASGTAVVTSGLTYADLLSVAAIAGEHQWPLLLANASGVPAVEEPLLRSLGIRTAYVVGSIATVSQAAVDSLERAGIHVIRIEGATPGDPYGTEAALMTTFRNSLSWHTVYLADGGTYLAGLEASPAVAHAGSMLVQVPSSGSIPAELAAAIAGLRGKAASVTAAGGTVPSQILRAVEYSLGL